MPRLLRHPHDSRIARGSGTQVQTTARYAHLARDSIQNAAARITRSIVGNLAPDGQRAPDDASD